jgi:hypothetical protein
MLGRYPLWRNGETELSKHFFLICLIIFPLFSSVVASAQTIQSATVPEQIDPSQPFTSGEPLVDETERSEGPQATQGRQKPDPGTSVGPTPGATTGTAPGTTTTTSYTFPSGKEMTHYWLRNVAGPRAAFGATFTASWHTWVDEEPQEWHRDFGGWSKRFGSSLLDNTINQSSLVLLSRAMGQDPMYYRCACTGSGHRTVHAIKMAFTARNHSGDRVFSPAKIIAPFTGPLVTRSTIYPDRFGPSDAFGVSSGAYYLVGAVAWNVIREFFWKSPRW